MNFRFLNWTVSTAVIPSNEFLAPLEVQRFRGLGHPPWARPPPPPPQSEWERPNQQKFNRGPPGNEHYHGLKFAGRPSATLLWRNLVTVRDPFRGGPPLSRWSVLNPFSCQPSAEPSASLTGSESCFFGRSGGGATQTTLRPGSKSVGHPSREFQIDWAWAPWVPPGEPNKSGARPTRSKLIRAHNTAGKTQAVRPGAQLPPDGLVAAGASPKSSSREIQIAPRRPPTLFLPVGFSDDRRP